MPWKSRRGRCGPPLRSLSPLARLLFDTSYGSYSHAGIKGFVDKPVDRTPVIKALIEKAGGKLIALYLATGPHDLVVVFEVPDGADAVAVGMAAGTSGSLSRLETVRAWTAADFKDVAEKASKIAGTYTPPPAVLRCRPAGNF